MIAALLLAVSLIAGSPGRADMNCDGKTCTCHSQQECDTMFRDKCDASSGLCHGENNDSVYCFCRMRTSIGAPPNTGKTTVRPEKVDGVKGVKQ
jgi:hypothetical protein